MIRNHIVYSQYTDYQFTVTKAEGVYVWKDDGQRLLDFTSGWNVTNLGWNHPEVTEAFIRQAQKNTYASMWTADPIQEEYAAAITAAYPGMDVALRTTGGTEANEVAVKLARAATGRTKVIGFKDTYHGQLFASMALGYRPEFVTAISPLVPDFIQLDYPAATGDDAQDAKILADCKTQLEAALARNDVAAIFIEPGIVTGWGACRMAPEGFVSLVRELAQQHGTLMVIDEVGTGFSRLGTLFGIDAYAVTPDIATFAKGVTNGTGGLGVVLTRTNLVKDTIERANYTSTFGWMPTACAAALATLRVHKRDKVWENTAAMGAKLMQTLRAQLPQSVEVRGRGLELCVDLANNAVDTQKIQAACLADGLAIAPTGDHKIQLMPPCVIAEPQLMEGAAILVAAIKTALKSA